MTSSELTFLITSIANLLAREIKSEELSVLSASLTQLGDTIATIQINEELLSDIQSACKLSSSTNTQNVEEESLVGDSPAASS